LNLVQNLNEVALLDIRRDYKDRDRQFDLKQFFTVTDHGREYLNLRAEMMSASDSG
jgi:hypothetical protein